MLKIELDLSKYHFYNFPKPLERSDYLEVCDLVVNNFKNNPDIVSLYLEKGSEWVPGISDLDILIVYKNGASVQASRNLSEKARLLLDYGSYDEQNFQNLYYLIPDRNNVKLLWGKEISIRHPKEELSFKDYQSLTAMVIFDLLIKKLLPHPRFLMNREINVRTLLGELYSLIYTLEMFEIISGKKEGGDFPAKIKRLKNNWFNGTDGQNIKELASLFKEGVNLILEMTAGLADFIKSQSLPTDSGIIFKNRRHYIVFDENWGKEKFFKNFMNGSLTVKNPFSSRTIENFKLILPGHLSYFLMAWAAYSGPLSDWIRKGVVYYQKPTSFIVPEGMERRIVKTNDFVKSSIENHGFFKIPYSYGLLAGGQTMTSKLGERIILLLRNIKK